MGEKGAYSRTTDDVAVIYITCKKENCATEAFTGAFAMPHYVYLTEIPTSVSSISIVVSKE